MSFATNRLDLKYVYTPTEELIFETHSDYWNQNSVNVFVAVSDNKCYIINAREKPEERDPLNKNINIETFDYGINSEGFEKDKLKEILKESVDSTYFFDFIIEKQKTTHEVDKDLLLNLIALRNDLVKGRNERIVYLLILRCLFIKYLEDRGIYSKNYLLDILRSGLPEKPGLIVKTLVRGNALVDDKIFKGKKFDCIIANPPWGSVPVDEDPENQKERKAIDTKGKEGTKPEYKNVSDYERSQAFLLRVGRWGGKETIFSLVVKNSIFLNENAEAFRKELLEKYRLNNFYELSNLNKILFKKK